MKYYDISPALDAEIAVFPGDQKFAQTWAMHVDRGDRITLSSIQTTVHVGAHIDAPLHYLKGGADITGRPLDIYFGRAQVITVKKDPHQSIQSSDLEKFKLSAPRMLIRTESFPNPKNWNGDFVALSPSAVDYLASKKVKLVGIDTPSVDLADSKDLPAHAAIAKYDMTILEGIVLGHVPDGIYTLIALPLKIKNADASPVRAILIDQDLEIG